MIIFEYELVKARAISRCVASQIQRVTLDWGDGSLHRQVEAAIKSNTAKVLGWAVLEAHTDKHILVEWEDQFYWYLAADKLLKGVKQIFVLD